MSAALGEFLKARRARVLPESLGLNVGLRPRRVPGLRREEVAELAGVSVDYYMRLEQGRMTNPSSSVLDAVARVLALSHDERRYLHDLVRPSVHKDNGAEAVASDLDEVMRRLLAGLAEQPALVLSPAMDVTGANAAAVALFGPMARPGENLLRYSLVGEPSHSRTSNWKDIATEAVASLRLQAARYPSDANITTLVEDLNTTSRLFAELWSQHDAHERGTTLITIEHPDVGVLSLTNIWLTPPTDSRRTLVVYTVEPGSVSAIRLEKLLTTIRP